MKNITYILLLFPLICLGQAILGQATFTQPQLDEMWSRYQNNGPFFNAANGIAGNGAEIFTSAEDFLLEEESGSFAHEWDWVASTTPLSTEPNSGFNSEPRPGGDADAGPDRSVDYDNYAAIVCAVFKNRADVITFAGQTLSADAHSERIAIAVRDLLIRRASDPEYDFGNQTKYPYDQATRGTIVSNNPFFIMTAKLDKYLIAYSLTYDKMPNGSNFTLLDNWFLDIANWCNAGLDDIYVSMIGETPPFANIPRAIDNAFVQDNYSGATYTHYDSSGNNGVNLIGRLQSTTCNNRMWDFITFLGTYGTLYNNSTFRDKNWELFKYYFQVGVFPDGTSNEWYRASGSSDGSSGMNYITVVAGQIVRNADFHAVAVTNGIPGVSDVGQYYEYTTSIGTDELISGYNQTSTSGGSKGVFAYLDNWRKYFLTPADGGFEGVRHTDTGGQINAYRLPYTVVIAMANSYYNNQDFTNFENMDTNEGFKYGNLSYPGTYPDGTVIRSSGAWGTHGMGTTWGTFGAQGGNYANRGMGAIRFSNAPTTGPGSSGEGVTPILVNMH